MSAPSGPSALVSIDDVYAHLNIPTADQTTDLAAELQTFIDAATTLVEFVTGPVVPKQYTENHNGGGETIVLYNAPVMQVDSVTEYVGPVAYPLTLVTLGQTDSIGPYSYTLDDPASGIIRRRWSGGIAGPFIGGSRNIAITYWSGRAAVPGDVKLATLEDIRGLYTQTQYGPAAGGVGGAAGQIGDSWAPTRGNPVGTFPRLTALLKSAQRTPAIA